MRTDHSRERTGRPFGLKLIIGYKLIKAAVVMALAIWLTVAPQGAYHVAERLARELSAASALWVRLGRWLEAHLSMHFFHWGALIAWVDSITTAVEGVLLFLGKAWGEWLVVIGVSALLVPEALSLEHHPGWGRLLVLLVNAAVVVYLLWRRLQAMRRPSAQRSSRPVTFPRGGEDRLGS